MAGVEGNEGRGGGGGRPRRQRRVGRDGEVQVHVRLRGCKEKSMGSGHECYRVGHLLADLGWVDLDLECSTILLGQ